MITSYHTKLAGVSFRQKQVVKLKSNTKLRCVAEPENQYDQYAVRVEALLSDDWDLIGYIQKGKNLIIQKELLAGRPVNIKLKEVTGIDKETLGVNVSIEYGTKDVNLNDFERQHVDYGDEDFVYFDAENHKTYDQDGNELRSGSDTERMHKKEVDLTYAAKAIAKKTGLKTEDVLDVWQAKADVSKTYGTALHLALENRIKYLKEMDALDEFKHRKQDASNWVPCPLGDIVNWVEDKLLNEFKLIPNNLHTEVRLKYKNLTGIADLLYVDEDKKNFILFDYKTNSELKDIKYEGQKEKMSEYTYQQNHYRTILENLGYKCLGMYLLHVPGADNKIVKLENVNIE